MGRIIRFIHTADLHLGSALNIRKKVGSNLSDSFQKASYNAFEKICTAAISQKVDFILISGDIYDRESRAVKANSFFRDQCRRLESHNIKVFAIGGNHDPINKSSELFSLPDNICIMSSEEVETVEVKDQEGMVLCRIIGQSYKENWESRKMYKNYILPKDGILNIALLHTQLDGSSSYIPCYPSDLIEMNSITYWALGHIHKPRLISKSPFIAYPGIPQGRDMGEDGLCGAFLVEAEENTIKSIQFIETSEIIWKKIDITLQDSEDESIANVTDLENLICGELEQLLESSPVIGEELKSVSAGSSSLRGYSIRMNISGRSKLYDMLSDRDEEVIQYLVDNLNNRFNNIKPYIYIDSLEINIGRPIENLKELITKNSTLREITNLTKLCLDDKETKSDIVKRMGSLWELNENYEDTNSRKLQLSEDLFESIIRQAEQLAIDELLQRSEEL